MLLLALASVAGACGHRMDHEALLAEAQKAASGSPSATGAGGTAAPGTGGSTATEGGQAAVGDTTAGTTATGGAATGGATGSASGGGTAAAGSATGGSTGSGTSGATAKQTCTGNESPITIGTVGTQSGAIGSIAGLGVKGVQVWVAMINAQGGLNCHKVRYIIYDDGGDPSRQQALMQQLIERDKAIAVVQHDAVLTGNSVVPYLESKGIPVIGSEGGSPWQYEHPNQFPQAATADKLYVAMTKGYGELARQVNKKKIGILACLEVSQCTRSAEIISQNAAKEGMQPVYKASGSLVQPDFTAQCQAAQAAGTEIFVVVLDNNGIKRVARSCNSVGFHPQFASISILANNELGTEPLLDGIVVPQPFNPWTNTSNAAVKQFVDSMAKYAPGFQLGGGIEAGWVSAKVFEEGAKNISANPTPAEVLKGLYQIKNNTLGNLTSPLTFTEGKNAPQSGCYWVVQMKGGKFVSFGSQEPKCF